MLYVDLTHAQTAVLKYCLSVKKITSMSAAKHFHLTRGALAAELRILTKKGYLTAHRTVKKGTTGSWLEYKLTDKAQNSKPNFVPEVPMNLAYRELAKKVLKQAKEAEKPKPAFTKPLAEGRSFNNPFGIGAQ